MNIQSTQIKPRFQPQAARAQAPIAQEDTQPQDSVTFGMSGNDIRAAAIMGGVGLMGAAVGAAAGNYTGAFAGIAGAIVGASAGASIAAHTPGEKVKTGMFLGAIGGAIAGASFGGPGAAVAMGVAGATLPYGAIIGIAVGIGGS
jgi:hypothetical protein